jgi:hypothetical protein
MFLRTFESRRPQQRETDEAKFVDKHHAGISDVAAHTTR